MVTRQNRRAIGTVFKDRFVLYSADDNMLMRQLLDYLFFFCQAIKVLAVHLISARIASAAQIPCFSGSTN
jgi:hypothetical protein